MIHTENTYVNAAICSKPEVLQEIKRATKNIAIHRRDIGLLERELAQLNDKTFECRLSGSKTEVLAQLADFFRQELPPSPVLLDDITSALEIFEQITEASTYRLLLATVSTNMCRKFHTDINYLRLLCTYLGPGTLWLPNEAADQLDRQKGKAYQEDNIEPHLIQQVRTGDMLILKGALFPDANSVLHRSPTIEKDGAKRLLLRIDTNDPASFWH
ncbi:MAG: DUF1826 domain-containing protein [Bacteroidota bacterium]